VAGPFLEDYDLVLSCHVMGGELHAKLPWWLISCGFLGSEPVFCNSMLITAN
jgi:hypothetical protein